KPELDILGEGLFQLLAILYRSCFGCRGVGLRYGLLCRRALFAGATEERRSEQRQYGEVDRGFHAGLRRGRHGEGRILAHACGPCGWGPAVGQAPFGSRQAAVVSHSETAWDIRAAACPSP